MMDWNNRFNTSCQKLLITLLCSSVTLPVDLVCARIWSSVEGGGTPDKCVAHNL